MMSPSLQCFRTALRRQTTVLKHLPISDARAERSVPRQRPARAQAQRERAAKAARERLIMSFSRDMSVFPRVWSRFIARSRDGWEVPLRIQDLPSDLDNVALHMLTEHFTRDEPPCRHIEVWKSPGALQELRRLWSKGLSQRVSLVCVRDDLSDDLPLDVVAVNILVVQDNEHEEPFETSEPVWRSLFGAVEELARAGGPAPPHLTAYGLVVLPCYRQMDIATNMLRARVPLCRYLGLHETRTVFTALGSQRAAEKAGFHTVASRTYKELKEAGFHFPGLDDDPKAISKLMALDITDDE